MKIVILHDDLNIYGGSEKVAIDIARSLETDNTIYVRKASIDAVRIAEQYGVKIKAVKGIKKTLKNNAFNRLRQIIDFTNINIRELNNEIKLIITTGEFAKYIIPQQNIVHIHYCHTPLRFLYDLRHYPSIRRKSKLFKNKFISSLARFPLYPLELAKYNMIDKVLVNSANVQFRLKKYLKVDSEILYPAIETKKYNFIESSDFFLSVQRLMPEKEVEEQILAFNKLKLRLLIVGQGWMYKNLKKLAANNIKFLGFLPEKELLNLYGRCKAFVATAENEDFGLTPLEAMASGKPVIAVNEGGFKETIIDGKTGVLYERGKLVEAINNFIKNENNFDVDVIKNHAAKFDISIFQKKLKNIISKYMNSSL